MMRTCFIIVPLLLGLLCSCGGTDYTYVDTREEKTGPGLFSGEDGVFTVVGAGEKAKKESEEKTTVE